MMEREAPADPAAQITSELRRIHLDSYGAGAERIDTYVIDDLYVLSVIQCDVTTAERTLLERGQGEAVRTTRMAYQEAIEPTFKAVVERAVGRQVESFISHVHLDPLYTLEFFRLAPRADELEEPV